jgi:hypothetical protein
MAMTSLFGPTPAEVMLAQQREQQQAQLLRNQMISQQGAEFGPFRGLYQAGLRFGDVGTQAAMQGLFPQQMDPRLQEASAVQSVLSKYADQDQTDPAVLRKIGNELMTVAPNAGRNALDLASKRARETQLLGLEERKVTAAEKKTESDIETQKELSQLRRDKLALEATTEARLQGVSDAEIKKINAQIRSLDADKYSFQVLKNAGDIPVGILAINKSNPEDQKTIPFGGEGGFSNVPSPGSSKGGAKPDKSKLGQFLFPTGQ